MQLSVCVQVPSLFDGCGGQALYIDTEGSYQVDRVREVGEGLLHHLRHMKNRTQQQNDSIKNMTVEDILKNIYYYRVHSFIEQIALVNVLPSFLTQHQNIKLIVLDSVTFHFRHGHEDMAHRSRLLHGFAQNLAKIAQEFDVAVVLMNQVTTKITGTGQSFLAPALGESWAHACTNRIVLFRKEDGFRYAHLYKSPSLKSATVQYDITKIGIRSIQHSKKRLREE